MPEQLPASPDPNRPFVVVMSAVTLDGKLTVRRGITSGSLGTYVTSEVVEYLHQMRAMVDAVMVGGNTIVIDNPSLTVRVVTGRNPVRVIVDPEGAVSLDAKVFRDQQAPTIVAVAGATSAERLAALRELDVEVITAGAGRFVDVAELMQKLATRGIWSLLVEGGATLNWLVISSGVVDELRLIKVPVVTGERNAPGFAEPPADVLSPEPVRIKCTQTEQVGNCVVLHCRCLK